MTHIELNELLTYLVTQGFQPGDRLPTIDQLAHTDHLGLSTGKVREQLEVARALGLVDVRSKTGIRLRPYSFAPAVRLSLLVALLHDVQMFEQFSSLRFHIEVAYWHEACAQLTGEDLALMQSFVEAAQEKLNDPRWIRIPHQEHRAFHLAVFRRLDNPFVLGLLEAYWDAYEAVELNRYADYQYLHDVWQHHARMLGLIVAGDASAALEVFIEHTRLLRHQPLMRGLAGRSAPHHTLTEPYPPSSR